MSIPSKVRICGKQWTVRLVSRETVGNDFDGHTIPSTRKIEIARGLSPHDTEQVFAHELMHAFLSEIGAAHTDGISALAEEIICDMFGHMIADNFKLVPKRGKNG